MPDMKITLIFQLQQTELPSQIEHLGYLWNVAKLLEPFGFPLERWHPPASTPKKSLKTLAFDSDGPTPAAVERLQVEDERELTTDYRIASVWNGNNTAAGSAFSVSLSVDTCLPTCVCDIQLGDLKALHDASNMQRLVLGLLEIWRAASVVEVGPFMYYTRRAVFPRRPGAGWMLYLPKSISATQLPEAAELVPVMEGGKQRGTIIVSVADEMFSVDNADHVRIANAIEIRLADQDLLPR
jgi:hypothetical protein